MKELKYAKANTTKQQMQANRTTQVVVLDGSKAMRNLSTNNMSETSEISAKRLSTASGSAVNWVIGQLISLG